MTIRQGLCVRAVLLAALSTLTLMGQGDRGLITGTVTDASGAVVPGSHVTVIQKNTNTSYKSETSSAGNFTVPSLPIGEYMVRVEKEGFKNHDHRQRGGDARRIDECGGQAGGRRYDDQTSK